RSNSRPPPNPSTNGTSNHLRNPTIGRPSLSSSNSVVSSREVSPIRPNLRSFHSTSSSRSVSRSRLSSDELDLSRPPSDSAINKLSSELSIQNKLANLAKPTLLATQENPPDAAMPVRSPTALPEDGSHRFSTPTSPRLR